MNKLFRRVKNRIIDKINKSEDLIKVLQTARLWKVRIPKQLKEEEKNKDEK
jgi:hypothetical protein